MVYEYKPQWGSRKKIVEACSPELVAKEASLQRLSWRELYFIRN